MFFFWYILEEGDQKQRNVKV